MTTTRIWSPKVRSLLALVLGLVLTSPLFVLWVARIYDNQLIRQTEEVLISEAVVIGELVRSKLDAVGAAAPLPAMTDPAAERYHPFFPQLDLREDVLPPATRSGEAHAPDSPLSIELGLFLEKTQVRNLSAVRILDRGGAVIASSLPEIGYSMGGLREVERALSGHYGASLRRRQRLSSEGALLHLARSAAVYVSIAVPVFRDPRAPAGSSSPILGVVFSSRTPLDPGTALWLLRRELYLPAAICVGFTVLITVLLSLLIARPLSDLRSAAERVARGDKDVRLVPTGFAPEEVRALSESLQTMREELEKKARYVREFAANAVHELKTPLTSMRGASELMLENAELMPKMHVNRFLENIHLDALRMERLVQGILDLARIETLEPERTMIEVRPFFAGLVERFAKEGQEIHLVQEHAPASLYAAPIQLESLVVNLLDNAVRHGEKKPIWILVEPEKGGVSIEVKDQGPGISEPDVRLVFDRFYTTERGRGGTGLGLAIVKAVAEAHGGRVEVVPRNPGVSLIAHLPSRHVGS